MRTVDIEVNVESLEKAFIQLLRDEIFDLTKHLDYLDRCEEREDENCLVLQSGDIYDIREDIQDSLCFLRQTMLYFRDK